MDLLEELRLQIAWGADEALADVPIDRLQPIFAPQSAPERTVAPPDRPPPAPLAPGRAAQAAAAVAAEAATPEALRAALEQFDGCDLRHSATSLAFADGNPAAGLIFVGEAPGSEEDRSGRPFDGPGGQLLDRMLASIGLDRTHFLLTYAIPWRPPGGRPASEAEVAACLPFLHRHLALLRPRHVVTLGVLPTRLLTGTRQPFGKLRGRWIEAAVPGLDRAVPVLPMLHPDQVRDRPAYRPDAWSDLLTLRRALDLAANDSATTGKAD